MGPGAALLHVKHVVGLGYGLNIEHAVWAALFGPLRREGQEPLAMDAAVDNDVGDMDVLRSKFTG